MEGIFHTIRNVITCCSLLDYFLQCLVCVHTLTSVVEGDVLLPIPEDGTSLLPVAPLTAMPPLA